MHSITFTCETITPMFLSGADGTTPELRAPSIKGALRFWWRAMNFDLSLPEMKRQEAIIFGGVETNTRSKVIIRVPFKLYKTSEFAMLPHRQIEKGYGNPSFREAICPGESFTISLTTTDETLMPAVKLQALFEFIALLSGVGKRSRRGMGAFVITSINGQPYSPPNNLQGILSLTHKLSTHFALMPNNYIANTYNGNMTKYPFIRLIHVSSNTKTDWKALVSKIGSVASKLKKDRPVPFEPSLGHAFRGRFASPVVASVTKNSNQHRIVIATLNAIPNRDENKIDLALQNDFREQILI